MLLDEDGRALTCYHCGRDVDWDEGEEAWYHTETGFEDFYCENQEDVAEIKCNFVLECTDVGQVPITEETRDQDDVVLNVRYVGFMCQRHAKVAALVMAKQPVPYQLLPYEIAEEETP